MLQSLLLSNDRPVLLVGAHSDDIEIGCGATIIDWLSSGLKPRIHWVVLSGKGPRGVEAKRAAHRFVPPSLLSIEISDFDDASFPSQYLKLQRYFSMLRKSINPGVVFTHYREDFHQDHRLVSELTWGAFRDHLILEYEVPKYDGDLGRPNAYFPISRRALNKKVSALMAAFPTQRGKNWFTRETFASLPRLRGIECRSETGYAEAFYARKLIVSAPGMKGSGIKSRSKRRAALRR